MYIVNTQAIVTRSELLGSHCKCLVFQVQRGNLKKAIELFDKAIPLANTELEMVRIKQPSSIVQGAFFNCSHPKISKCQPVSKLRLVLRTVPTLKKTKKEKS